MRNRTYITKIKIQNYRCFRNATITFDENVNILIGGNEAGKSTILEAISLATSGRLNGRWASEELHPYWFNLDATADFFERYESGESVTPPKILIEVYFNKAGGHPVLSLQGTNNSSRDDVPGLLIEIDLDPEFESEFYEYMALDGDGDRPRLIPTEYFRVRWSSFNSTDRLGRKPRGVRLAKVDHQNKGWPGQMDFYSRQLLIENIDDSDAAKMAAEIRLSLNKATNKHLVNVNHKLETQGKDALQAVRVQLNQAAAADWRSSVTAEVNKVPFFMSGQAQQAVTKIELALLESKERTDVVLVEEPENHLSHTRLRQVVERLKELSVDRQLILTTHSSFVLNRLGLDQLRLVERSQVATFSELPKQDVDFFKKLPNFDTLRLILADKVALVEGPSDQIILEYAFEKISRKSSAAHGVDIISIDGTSFKRWFNLARILRKPVFALRDNDGKTKQHWEGVYSKAMGDLGQLFTGKDVNYKTLEPQIIAANQVRISDLLKNFEVDSEKDLKAYMTSKKTEAALSLCNDSELVFPEYIKDAVRAMITSV